MASIPDFLSLATTLVVLGLIVAGVMKLFQIGNDMQEMKQILQDIRLGAHLTARAVPPPVPYHAASSPSSYPAANIAALGEALPEGEPVPQPVPGNMPGMNFSKPPTAEELVRAIHAHDFKGDDFPL